MNLRKSWLNALAGLLLAGSAMASSGPDEVVRDTAGKVLDKLSANEADYQANPALLADVVRDDLLPIMDLKYTARLILGRAGREASQDQLDRFAEAMANLLISRYSDGLLSYNNRDQLEIMPLRGEPNDRMTRVRTRIGLNNGKFVPVDYVFRKSGQDWKVFDVIVEGISYVTTYRNQIMPEVQERGLDAVIERLERGEIPLEQ